MSTKSADPVKPASFEQLMQELETIVKNLEQGEVPLEEAIQLFERGVKLSNSGLAQLDQAEKKVEVLLAGEVVDKTAELGGGDNVQ